MKGYPRTTEAEGRTEYWLAPREELEPTLLIRTIDVLRTMIGQLGLVRRNDRQNERNFHLVEITGKDDDNIALIPKSDDPAASGFNMQLVVNNVVTPDFENIDLIRFEEHEANR